MVTAPLGSTIPAFRTARDVPGLAGHVWSPSGQVHPLGRINGSVGTVIFPQ
jgi:hypothetical protein